MRQWKLLWDGMIQFGHAANNWAASGQLFLTVHRTLRMATRDDCIGGGVVRVSASIAWRCFVARCVIGAAVHSFAVQARRGDRRLAPTRHVLYIFTIALFLSSPCVSPPQPRIFLPPLRIHRPHIFRHIFFPASLSTPSPPAPRPTPYAPTVCHR